MWMLLAAGLVLVLGLIFGVLLYFSGGRDE